MGCTIVKLKNYQCFGTDSTTGTAYITVRRPRKTNVKSDYCLPFKVLRNFVTGTGTMNWYDASSGGNLVGTGKNPFYRTFGYK